MERRPPDAHVTTRWTHEDEERLGTKREDPAHKATWEACVVLPQGCVGESYWSVMPWEESGVDIVKFCAKAWKINDIAKELAPLGHEVVGCISGVKRTRWPPR